jgi:hypothetical protein
MWGWVDGHLVLVALLCPVVAFVAVGLQNARLRRRALQRHDIFTRAGA